MFAHAHSVGYNIVADNTGLSSFV